MLYRNMLRLLRFCRIFYAEPAPSSVENAPGSRKIMTLVPISAADYGVDIRLAYATAENFTGRPIYRHARCYLHADAAAALRRAVDLAGGLGYRLKIFDAFRPSEAQWVMWTHTPDPEFLADPRRGSPHSRGIALDLTLLDAAAAA